MLRGLRAMMGKEFRHIRRDRKGLAYILLLPFIQVFFLAYGINIDLRDVRTAVIDSSRGALSADLLRSFRDSGVFTLRDYGSPPNAAASLDAAEKDLLAGRVREILIIPSGFDAALRAGSNAEIGIVLDGTDARSTLFLGSLGSLHERLAAEFGRRHGPSGAPAAVRTRLAFNPEGRSAVSLIPGLIIIVLLVVSTLMTSVSIAREKELGSVELLALSPIATRDIILGKAVPYALLAFFDGAVTLFLARVWFDIPFRGSLAALVFFSSLYVVTGVSIGILISTAFRTQREAMIAAVLTTLMPAFFLSGFIIPRESLPAVLRGLSTLVPGTYFMEIVRGLLLRGAEAGRFIAEGAVLAGFAAVGLGSAIWNFSRQRRRGQ
jgi:ABC-2 type transport system permease protein